VAELTQLAIAYAARAAELEQAADGKSDNDGAPSPTANGD
jgi:hypothetical protein